MKRSKKITLTAVLAALLAIISWISIPTPFVPVTLQVFGVALCGFVLGAKFGLLSVLVFLGLGALGVPVFSSMQGGIGVLFSANGGFLLSFPLLAFLCGIGKTEKRKILLSLLGVAVCHVCGVLQFSAVTGSSILLTAVSVSLPFILKDILLIFAARFVARKTERLYD